MDFNGVKRSPLNAAPSKTALKKMTLPKKEHTDYCTPISALPQPILGLTQTKLKRTTIPVGK